MNILSFFPAEMVWVVRYALMALDVVLVYLLIYYVLSKTWRSPAFRLIKGLFVILCVSFVSRVLGLSMLNWVLGKFAAVVIVIVIIIFQPELRRLLEWIGSVRSFFSPDAHAEAREARHVKALLRALEILAKEKVGALVVLEMNDDLIEYAQSGVAVHAEVSPEVLSSLIWPGSPTHDGAVILRQNRIAAAGCLLPLTDAKLQDRRLGTRHRAALGLSELTDALVFVVSEETGIISMAEGGKLTRYLNREAIETRLFNVYKES